MHALDVVPQGIVLADAGGAIVFRNRAASGFFVARHSEALVESAITELIAAAVAGQATTRTLDLYGPPRRALQLRAVPLDHENGPGPRPGPSSWWTTCRSASASTRCAGTSWPTSATSSRRLWGRSGCWPRPSPASDDPEVVARLAERMQQEAFRVARTIDDLLQLSQIEAGELPSRDPVPVHLVLAEAVDRTRAAAEMQGVTLHVDEPAPAA